MLVFLFSVVETADKQSPHYSTQIPQTPQVFNKLNTAVWISKEFQ